MLFSNTVFVLGAGAHKDLKMPLGYELAATIARKTNIASSNSPDPSGGDRELMHAAMMHPEIRGRVQAAARAIHAGISLANSIDDFLDLRKADKAIVQFGKLAIVKSILEAEATTALGVSDHKRVDFSVPAYTNLWQTQLIKMLSRELADKQFSKITFVNFNYDRCLEKFLVEAVSALHGLSIPDAATIVNRIRIFRPYGQAGRLPELGGTTEFGLKDNMACIGLAEQIKTYTEELEVTKELRELHTALDHAKTVIFLGFAFHPQNIALLTKCGLLAGESGTGQITEIFATATNFSDPAVEVLKRRISSMFAEKHRVSIHRTITIRNQLDCSGFLKEYGPVFSEL